MMEVITFITVTKIVLKNTQFNFYNSINFNQRINLMKRTTLLILTSLLTIGVSTAIYAGAGHDDGHSTKKTTKGHDDGHGEGHGDGGHEMSAVGMPMPVDSTAATKTITVHMMDSMKFNFSDLAGIKKGDIIKFVVMNKGKIPHEFGIGSIEEQTAHRKMMQSMPGMKHEDGATVSVEPGMSKDLIWHFMGDATTVQFACNVPGHFEAGMHSEVKL